MQRVQRPPEERFPVSVFMERRAVQRGPWTQTQWTVTGVLANQDTERRPVAKTLIHSGPEREEYVWTGHCIELFKDGAEGYWYNLLSDAPYLFVVCYPTGEEADDAALAPVLVTANQDEATGHLESDDQVFSVPMPPEVRDWVERFVVANYVPEPKKKRKRRDWTDEAERTRPRARRD